MTGIHIYRGLAAAFLMAITTVLSADDDPDDNSERDERIEIIRDFASRHRMAADSAPDEPLELQRPLMSWTNPTRSGWLEKSFCGLKTIDRWRCAESIWWIRMKE